MTNADALFWPETRPAEHAVKIAVLDGVKEDRRRHEALAGRLSAPLWPKPEADGALFYLGWRNDVLTLFDDTGALNVDIYPRAGEQRSFPAPKQGPLAQAVGRKTRTVADATTGWAQDSLALFRMGYQLICLERSPLMFELAADGFRRLGQLDWVRKRNLAPPLLIGGDAIERLAALPARPDCIYLDPMFPPRRKKSALPQKSMRVLRTLAGSDPDKHALFAAAWDTALKRVVVKSPDDCPPFAGKPSQSVCGKLVRYDVYLK